MHVIEMRNALVTGASGGIGARIATALAAEGANVALAARSTEKLEALAAELRSKGATVAVVPADITSKDDLRNLPRRVRGEFGQIDLLINNAGIEDLAPFHRQDPDMMQSILDTNLLAPMMLVREVLPHMLDRRRGHIVNIASLAGKFGLPYEAVYSASKAGLIAWSSALRHELDDTGIGVSVVAPGFVGETGMFARSGHEAPKSLRLSSPDDVAKAVIDAIRRNLPEVLVNPIPVRPFLVLKEAAPRLAEKLDRMGGLARFMKRLAGG